MPGPTSKQRHFTTRRGFIATLGLGGASLYGLWAAYGAAPGPLGLFGLANPHRDDTGHAATGNQHDAPAAAADGHSGGHSAGHSGGHSAGEPAVEEFRRRVAAFSDRFRMPDGSIYPRHDAPASMPAMPHAAHAMPAMPHDSHATPSHDPGQHVPAAPAPSAPAAPPAADAHDKAGPVEVYILAEKWFYEPAHLRLDTGTPYSFRMMAADISHGASIQFGRGSRIIRLRPNVIANLDVTFKRPGDHFVYCTVYCGMGHDRMQARIEIV